MDEISKIRNIVQKRMKKNDPAHNFDHILRVYSNAEKLIKTENANKNLVLSAVLLHDIVSYPKNDPRSKTSSTKSSIEAQKILKNLSYSEKEITIISQAIDIHSFFKNKKPKTLEGKILQDADRLDAIGAIGIARAFATGGSTNRTFYDKSDPFCKLRKPDDTIWTLDHFYKKLLQIEKKMNTKSGKKEAKRRTEILKKFLSDLKKEI